MRRRADRGAALGEGRQEQIKLIKETCFTPMGIEELQAKDVRIQSHICDPNMRVHIKAQVRREK